MKQQQLGYIDQLAAFRERLIHTSKLDSAKLMQQAIEYEQRARNIEQEIEEILNEQRKRGKPNGWNPIRKWLETPLEDPNKLAEQAKTLRERSYTLMNEAGYAH